MEKLSKKLFPTIKFTVISIINTVFIIYVGNLLSGVTVSSNLAAFIFIIILSILNASLWPLFSRLALPLTVSTLGLGALALNIIYIYIVDYFVPGIEITSFTDGLIITFALTLSNTLISELLSIDDDYSYNSNVIKKQSKRFASEASNSTIPGLIILQFDGLAYKVLRRALLNGEVPTINKLVRSGKYRLEKWETDWSSQTGASQTGILLGSNQNIPAYRWYQKSLNRTVSVGNPKDAKLIEKKLSNGKGLLFANGASRGNLFSGDASDNLLTLSKIGTKNSKGTGYAYYAFFSNPYNLPRLVILFTADALREVISRFQQARRDIYPRLKKINFSYPLLRASMTVGQRDILFQTLLGDIFEGKPIIYADFVGYDEVSHHTGPERHETLSVLRDLDKQVRRLDIAIKQANRPYNIIILSDHGQTQGETFKQRSGYSLEDLVNKNIAKANVVATDNKTEGSSFLNAAVDEITFSKGITSSILKRIKHNSIENKKHLTNIKDEEDVEVLASGCLGLIYFTKYKHRLTLEEIELKYPNLIKNLVNHPYIGFLLVNSKKQGPMVIGPKGKYFLKTNKIAGSNPLKNFGPSAHEHIRRTNSFDNCADIMINSYYDPKMKEVAAFEELVGSHGGLGGNQSYPFVLFPSEFYYPTKHIVGASNIHLLIKRWLNDLGHTEYKDLYKKPNSNKFN